MTAAELEQIYRARAEEAQRQREAEEASGIGTKEQKIVPLIAGLAAIGAGVGTSVDAALKADEAKGDVERQFKNAWYQERLRKGIDETPFHEQLEVPEWARKDAYDAYQRSRLDTGAQDTAGQRMDASQLAYLQAAQGVGGGQSYDAYARQAEDDARARIQSQLASQRHQTAAAQRQAAYAQSGARQAMAGRNAVNAAQDAQARRAAYAQAIAGVRGAGQQALTARQAATLGAGRHALGQEQVMAGHTDMGINAQQNKLKRQTEHQYLKTRILHGEEGREHAANAAQREMQTNIGTGLVNAGASMMQTSDVRAKTNIEPAGDDDNIAAYLAALEGRA